MKRYKVEMQREGSVKYFFIRDMETLEIVLLPSKYLMHQVRANRSPNTIRRNAFALAYYWEYLLEEEHEAEDVYGMDYETQYDFFAEYLKWLKAGKHTDNLDKEPQNKTCNAYLKKVILKIQKEAYGYACLTNDKNYYLENYPPIAVETGRIAI